MSGAVPPPEEVLPVDERGGRNGFEFGQLANAEGIRLTRGEHDVGVASTNFVELDRRIRTLTLVDILDANLCEQ